MVGDITNINLLLKIAGIDIELDGIKMLNGSTVDFNAGIEALEIDGCIDSFPVHLDISILYI